MQGFGVSRSGGFEALCRCLLIVGLRRSPFSSPRVDDVGAVVHIHQLSQVQHVEGPVALAVTRSACRRPTGRKSPARDGR
jgi:hypothetical protein